MFRYSLLGLICLTLLAGSGCQSLDLFSKLSGRKPLLEADAEHPAVEILCFWEPAEGRGLDNLPTRGFAGQILFFSAGRSEPVKVEGDVRIYLFDDQGTVEEQSRPIHQFDFTAEAWNTYLRETNVGAAYQLFIPYTRKGVHAAECSLRVRFTPKNGLPLYSKMAAISLPGKKVERSTSGPASPELAAQPPAAEPSRKPTGHVQLAAHQDVAPPRDRQADRQADRPNFSETIRPRKVELTSGTAPAVPPAVEQRLDRLEQMLQTLVEHNSPSATSPTAEMPPSGTNESAANRPDTGRQRYRLAPSVDDTPTTSPAAMHPLIEQSARPTAPAAHPLRETAAQWSNATAVPAQGSLPDTAAAPARHPLLD